MRFGLFALSLAMLTSGGFAVQSAYAITRSATDHMVGSLTPRGAIAHVGSAHGPLPFAMQAPAAGRAEPR